MQTLDLSYGWCLASSKVSEYFCIDVGKNHIDCTDQWVRQTKAFCMQAK